MTPIDGAADALSGRIAVPRSPASVPRPPAANRGQFDDLETPALRMLHDDEERILPANDRGPVSRR
jgi:Cytochrome oxidase maturation protein cbb3-type